MGAVHLTEIGSGFWRWTAPHPDWTPESEWGRDVSSVYYEAPRDVCLIDPLVPAGEEERFWRALDRDVERVGKPVAILLTVPWHRRSAQVIGERYGAESEGWELSLRSREPPLGVEAIEVAHTDERIFWLPQHRALVAGDVLLGVGGGDLSVCPVSWVTREESYPEDFVASLRRLLQLPVETVLVSHGEAVLSRGGAALREAIEVARERAERKRC